MKRKLMMVGALALVLVAPPGRAAWAQMPDAPPDAGSDEPWAGLDDGDAGPDVGGDARGPMGPGMPRMGHGGMRGHRGGGMGGAPMRMARELDLTDAQREKFAALRDREQRKSIQARADIGVANLDLRKLMRAEKPDVRAIDAQVDRIAALRAGLQKARIGAMLEMRAALTPDQQKKMRELRRPGPGGRRMMRDHREGGSM